MNSDNDKESLADSPQQQCPRTSRRPSRSNCSSLEGVISGTGGGAFCGRHGYMQGTGVDTPVAAPDLVNPGRRRVSCGGASPASCESPPAVLLTAADRQNIPSRASPFDVSVERLRQDIKLRRGLAAGTTAGVARAPGGGSVGARGGVSFTAAQDAGGTLTMLSTTSHGHSNYAEGFSSPPGSGGSMGGVLGSFTYVQLQLLAFIIVFSASGLVPRTDLVFVGWVSVYTLMLAKFVFPVVPRQPIPKILEGGDHLFHVFVLVGALLGVFLPMAYSLGGFSRGDQTAMRASTPHLFLLSCQILTENFVVGTSFFSVPTRVLVSVMYNARRLFSLADWMSAVYGPPQDGPVIVGAGPAELVRTYSPDLLWTWFGRALALTNMVFWSFNLFCILLPVHLPRAFRKYFEQEAAAGATAAGAEVSATAAALMIGHHSTTARFERHEAPTAAPMTLHATTTTITPHHPKYQ
ncbi:hypothetical protein CBR_g18915 [Chara braunii]|uniref:DUF7733 domain-containing protein n=1 Tax=Chara braunii TaxID=69332 RepID=A0A388KWS3_CHABU|nr:hypothetical protein CBR_g18915 [Chara braunii]|eukprot:GBG74505.1 hypothetical protein CBR_g18915 [Chara braunii]